MPDTDIAVITGASGGIGAALVDALYMRGVSAVEFSRDGEPALDITDERQVRAAAAHVASLKGDLRLMIDATGFLHDGDHMPEKSMSGLTSAHLARAFAANAVGPALLMKHFLPLLPAKGRSVFATLSARVGSISDNQLGGWHAYRASKAALNQLVRTCSIELARQKPGAICVALHPGTVDTGLSRPFGKAGLDVRPPAVAAEDIMSVINGLRAEHNGGFFDQNGDEIGF